MLKVFHQALTPKEKRVLTFNEKKTLREKGKRKILLMKQPH